MASDEIIPRRRKSVSLRHPIAGAASASRIATPGSSTGRARQSSRTRGILVLNGDRSAHRTRPCHVTSEPYQIRMCHDPVGDVDGEIISRIATTSLRHKDKVPRPVVRRARLRDGGEGNKACCGCCRQQKLFHRHSSTIMDPHQPAQVFAPEP